MFHPVRNPTDVTSESIQKNSGIVSNGVNPVDKIKTVFGVRVIPITENL